MVSASDCRSSLRLSRCCQLGSQASADSVSFEHDIAVLLGAGMKFGPNSINVRLPSAVVLYQREGTGHGDHQRKALL
jgi:hypothetical protein